jgi:hypothetical protein
VPCGFDAPKQLPSLTTAARALLDSLRSELGSAREQRALAESLADSRGTELEELQVRGGGGQVRVTLG